MFKKLSICFLLLTLVPFTSSPIVLADSTQTVSVPSFSDIPVTSEHFAALEYLKTRGIISGYPDKTFQPDKTINRAEALKVLLLAAKIPMADDATLKKTTLPFPDVKAVDWFYKFVKQAFSMHIVQGYPDKTFKPENAVNFAESLKLMVLTFQIDVSAISADAVPYPDVEPNSWYTKSFSAAKARNLIAPDDDGKVHPEKEMTRGDFAEIVYRIVYLREDKVDKFPVSLNWPRFVHPTAHYSLQYPFDWQTIDAAGQIVFWKQDTINGQVSFSRVFPNGATVIAAVDSNPNQYTLDQYLSKIQYDSQAEIKKLSINSYPSASVAIAGNGLRDYYIELPNHAMLILYCQGGDGVLKEELQSEIQYLAESVRYENEVKIQNSEVRSAGQSLEVNDSASQQVSGTSESSGTAPDGGSSSVVSPSASELLLSKVRAALLQKQKGQEMLALFPDKVIIETDTIGVGTGPVDYYYSAQYDVTLKYERTSDTLLAMKNGKTSAF